MNKIAQSSWVSPEGEVFPLGGRGHAEFAYDILFNEKLGEHMSKKLPTDGTTEQKGKSGEVAAAEAHHELGGNPSDPKHAAELCERGWVQASDADERMIIRSKGIDALRGSWSRLSSMFREKDSVVFVFSHLGSGGSAGLCRKDLANDMESVLGRISEMASGRVQDLSMLSWSSQGHGIRYFE